MNVALVAHDSKKILMENLCIAYRHILSKHTLYATETTGRLVEETTGLSTHKYLAGHLGGEQQLTVQILHNDIDLVIYFYSTQDIHSRNNGNEILYHCDIHNIPFASNLATAEALLLALDRGDLDWREILKARH